MIGAVAGAVGILVLDMVSYLDMVIRGRPASQLSAQLVGKIAELAGVKPAEDGETWRNRASAIGALLGYVMGLGIGMVFGVIRARWPGLLRSVAVVGVGAAAMALADAGLVLFGLTDPRTWGLAGWLSDIVPHLGYGIAVVVIFDLLYGARRSPPEGSARRPPSPVE
ncbi:hypothetical protein GCM10023194_39610 [Planotetraspora phitsanulokensis]